MNGKKVYYKLNPLCTKDLTSSFGPHGFDVEETTGGRYLITPGQYKIPLSISISEWFEVNRYSENAFYYIYSSQDNKGGIKIDREMWDWFSRYLIEANGEETIALQFGLL